MGWGRGVLEIRSPGFGALYIQLVVYFVLFGKEIVDLPARACARSGGERRKVQADVAGPAVVFSPLNGLRYQGFYFFFFLLTFYAARRVHIVHRGGRGEKLGAGCLESCS